MILPSGKSRWKIHTDQLIELAFILYFSNVLIRLVFGAIFGNNAVINMVVSLLPYIPIGWACLKRPHKYLKWDFLILFVGIVSFFAVTILVHPEYEFHYFRDTYGVWDHVLKPYRGIYAFLFIRLIGEPKKILKCMKITGWIMMPYFVYKLYRGEWTTVGVSGVNTEATYSVTFGYEVLIFALVFLFAALTEKNFLYYVATIIDIIMILMGASRGPILFLGLFVILYLIIFTAHSRKKVLIILLSVTGVFLVYLYYNHILTLLMILFSRYGRTSRFIRMLLNGSILNDSNRFVIWNAAVQMIKDNPFGYGAMGSRHVIYNYVYVGYPHSIILEFLIDYGVFLGSGLLVFLFWNAFSILFSNKKREWCGVFLPFFCAACSMFISLTYWSRPEFWACLALGVCCYKDIKRKKRYNIIKLLQKRQHKLLEEFLNGWRKEKRWARRKRGSQSRTVVYNL